MIEKIVNNFVKHICLYLYQVDKDDRFRYWPSTPDWSSYLSFLSQPNQVNQESSFGGILIERSGSTSEWGLANQTVEYKVTVYLMRYLEPNSQMKLQKDLFTILSLLEQNSTLLNSEFCFDKSDLSTLIKKSKMGLVCGELKVNLLVDMK